ncbi:hypothetical protein [Pseudorhodobacter sp.]|uniref:hypothetical protein n=1 Tax=Pseudorhodobacter sp. TaxID=1934400 RepID=UPI002AFDD8DD|nr:hypothetical protein [Pseudorhodobacter sp.]
MQFKLSKSYRYWWPVTVRLPDPDKAGAIIEQQFDAQFAPLPREDMLAAQEASAKLTTLRALTDHEAAQVARIVKSWRGIVDDAGNDVPFTPELLQAALQQPWFNKAINEALTKSMNGEEARVGN